MDFLLCANRVADDSHCNPQGSLVPSLEAAHRPKNSNAKQVAEHIQRPVWHFIDHRDITRLEAKSTLPL
jgi:hypothetical protein